MNIANVLNYVKRYAKIDDSLATKIKREGVDSNFERIKVKLYPPSIRYKDLLGIVKTSSVSVSDNQLEEALRKLNVNIVEYNAEYHIMIPGDQSIKEADKYIFCVFGEEYSSLAKLKYNSTEEGMSNEDWETFYQDYWTIEIVDLECELIYIARRKPDIPEAVERRISYLKSLMCDGFRKDLLELQGKHTKVQLVAEVNLFLAAFVQEWMKEPTLLNWMKIEERLRL